MSVMSSSDAADRAQIRCHRVVDAVVQGNMRIALEEMTALREQDGLLPNQIHNRLLRKGSIGRPVRARIRELEEAGDQEGALALRTRLLNLTPEVPNVFAGPHHAEQLWRARIRGSRP